VWRAGAMAQNVCPVVCGEDRARLEAIVADRNRAHKHVLRARIVLHSADRLSVAEVARRVGVGRPAVRRWQRRFTPSRGRRAAARGVPQTGQGAHTGGDRRPGGGADLRRATGGGDPLDRPRDGRGERAVVAHRAAVDACATRRRAAHDLQPHRLTFKRSSDPDFAAKLEAIVGLYVDPPAHSLVLSLDESEAGWDPASQIQALDRTRPGLPIRPGKAGTPVGYGVPTAPQATHDDKRNGTTTPWSGALTRPSAALNVLDGKVIGRCMARHRQQEFIRFLNAIEREVPAGKVIHVILDNHGAHKHPKVCAWLARHPRWTFHSTPTSGSWLNAVETFFSTLSRRRLRRGAFRSIVELQAAIHRYLAEHNDAPQPFTWTKTADQILAKLTPLNAPVH